MAFPYKDDLVLAGFSFCEIETNKLAARKNEGLSFGMIF